MGYLNLLPEVISPGYPGLCLTREQFEQMRSHVSHASPQEACGVIAGLADQVIKIYPLTNFLQSPTRYRLDPREQLQAFLEIGERGWQLLGIYHSHPTGPGIPSPTDVREAHYPQVYHLIWSRDQDGWLCQAFCIRDGSVLEARLDGPVW